MERLLTKQNSLIKRIKNIYVTEDNSPTEAEEFYNLITTLYNNFENNQEKIEDEIDSENLENQIEVACDIQNFVISVKSTCKSIIAKSKPTTKDFSQSINKTQERVKLPEIPLPKFSGKREEWLSFKDLFTSIIENNNQLSDAQKFYYLRSSLQGEATSLIENLDVSRTSYTEAWKLLEDRFANKKLIIQAHFQTLLDQPSVKNEADLQRIIDTTNKSLRALKSLGHPEVSEAAFTAFLVLTKLPTSIRKEWELNTNSETAYPTYAKLALYKETRTGY